jgi:hypothetical protein
MSWSDGLDEYAKTPGVSYSSKATAQEDGEKEPSECLTHREQGLAHISTTPSLHNDSAPQDK